MNSESSNPSEKASAKLNCHRVMMQFLIGYNQEKKKKRFPLSQGFGNCEQGNVLSTKQIVEANSEEKVDRPGLDILGKLSHQMLSAASIVGNLYFHQMVCRSNQSLVLSLDGSQESKSLFLGVWQHKDQLAIH